MASNRENEEKKKDEEAVVALAFEENERINLHRQALYTAALRALEAVFERLPVSAIESLAAGLEAEIAKSGTPSPFPPKRLALTWFGKALGEPAFLKRFFENDPLAEARMRGLLAKKKFLQAEGGLVTGSELANLLNVSRQTIYERLKRGELFAVGEGDRKLPAWQVHGDKTLPGLGEVLAALNESDGMTILVFFLTSEPRLEGKTPLDVLRRGTHDDIGRVVAAARQYGEHGAH